MSVYYILIQWKLSNFLMNDQISTVFLIFFSTIFIVLLVGLQLYFSFDQVLKSLG